MQFLDANVRDKLIILGLILLGIGCLAGVYAGKSDLKEGLMIIITALAAAFKGNPSPDSTSPTASVTSTTETTSKETISDDKGNVA